MKNTAVVILLALALLLTACGGGEPTPAPATPTAVAAVEPTVTLAPTNTPPPEPTDTPEPDTGEVDSLGEVQAATIRIQADGSFYAPDGYEYSTERHGSGFIIDPEGIAVTNNHVVEGAAILHVWIGGEDEAHNARILGVSECADLAVIDIEGDGYPYLAWYEGAINPGLEVYAAGFPHGEPEYTLSRGIVTRAEVDGETDWASVDSVLQHQAPIAPGSSGGPLLTREGLVVAVNYAGGDDDLEYLAITGPHALPIIERLRGDEDVEPLGINPQAVAMEDGLNGIWVTSVRAGSPADQAGIKAGDLITEMAGKTFLTDETLEAYTMADYCDILRTQGSDATIDIEVVRLDTEEVLEGQINGRPLEASFSFADAGSDELPEEGETYSDYVPITDDTGAIGLEAPAEWDDIDGSPLIDEDDGLPFAASIAASTDLEAYHDYAAPGVEFAAMINKPGELTADQALDGFQYGDECIYEGREPYSDALYSGKYDHYSDCGGNGGVLFVVASFPEDQAYVTFVAVHALTDADLDAADHILATFEVIGDLPRAGAVPRAEGVTINVSNQTPDPICAIRIVPSDAESWGDNLLGDAELGPDESWAYTAPAGGTYDLQASDCSSAILGVYWEIAEDRTVTIGAPGRTVSLLLENQTDIDICQVGISPTTSQDWGDHWLGDPNTVFGPGNSWRFWVKPDTYDLLARDCDGEDVQQVDGVDLTQDKIWTLEPGGEGEQDGSAGGFVITVANQTPRPICEVFIVPSDSDAWGDNWLESGPIPAGSSREIPVNPGSYDVAARDCDEAYLGILLKVDSAAVLEIGGPGRTVFLLVGNLLKYDVCEVLISPPDSETWGENWLQEEGSVFSDLQKWRFWVEPGTYDILYRDCKGEDIERFDNQDLSENAFWILEP